MITILLIVMLIVMITVMIRIVLMTIISTMGFIVIMYHIMGTSTSLIIVL